MALALVIAARKGDVKIVRCILEEDVSNVFFIMDQAVEEGLTSLFEVIIYKEYCLSILMSIRMVYV